MAFCDITAPLEKLPSHAEMWSLNLGGTKSN